MFSFKKLDVKEKKVPPPPSPTPFEWHLSDTLLTLLFGFL